MIPAIALLAAVMLLAVCRRRDTDARARGGGHVVLSVATCETCGVRISCHSWNGTGHEAQRQVAEHSAKVHG